MFLGVEVRDASVIRLAIHVVGQVHEVGLLGCLRARNIHRKKLKYMLRRELAVAAVEFPY